MFRALAFLVLTGYAALAANNPIREVTSQATRAGNQLVPAFYNGYIYWVGREGDNHSVSIYAPDGHLAFGFDTPNGAVNSVAIDTDGAIAVAWGSWRSKAGGIDFRDSSGALQRTIQTGRYLPSHLSFAEDHSLWSLGCNVDATLAGEPDRQDYMTVRKYLPDGKEAGAYLPRSLFPADAIPGDLGWQRSGSITVAHDRVGLWMITSFSGDHSEWVELDLKGSLLGRWPVPDQFSSEQKLAFTTDGHLFFQTFDPETRAHPLQTLDHDSSSWRRVEAPPSGRLQGVDGNSLVFWDSRGSGPMHLSWYPHP